jgi:hypothetical protein
MPRGDKSAYITLISRSDRPSTLRKATKAAAYLKGKPSDVPGPPSIRRPAGARSRALDVGNE